MKVYNFNDVLESNGILNPEDSELYYIVNSLDSIDINIDPKGPWVAGGAVLRTFYGQPLDTDIDLFFNGQPQYDKAYEKMKENALFLTETKFSSSFKIILDHKGKEKTYKIQLVKFIFSEKATGIIDNFDIDICKIAFDGKRIVLPEETYVSIKNKKMKLNIDDIKFPIHTLKRLVKYANRGFEIDEEMLQSFGEKFLSNDVNSTSSY